MSCQRPVRCSDLAMHDAGYEVVGASIQDGKSHQKFIEKHELPFHLVADVDQKLVQDRIWCVFWGVCDLIMILGSLSANGWGCVSVLRVFWHRVSSTVACWSLSGTGSSR